LRQTDFDDLLTFDVSSGSASPSPCKSPAPAIQLRESPKKPARRPPVPRHKVPKKRNENEEPLHPVRSCLFQENEPNIIAFEPAALIQLDEPADLIAFDSAQQLMPLAAKQPPLNPDLMCLFTPFTIEDLLDLAAVPPVPFSVKNFVHTLFGVPSVVNPGGSRRPAETTRWVVEIEVIADDGSSRRLLPAELNEFGGGKMRKAGANRAAQKHDVLPVTIEDLEAAFGHKVRRKEGRNLLFCE
jgi:hypothetical protein